MNSFLQLICLVFSFLYGLFLYFILDINNRICFKFNIFFIFIINVLIINNLSLLYIFILYKLNKGVFNNYFLIFTVIGFGLKYVNKRK